MLIRIDENISWRIADALKALGMPPDVILETAHHREEAGVQDIDWIQDFSNRDGRLFISGDASMRSVHLERAALEASNLIAVFPSSKAYFDGLRKWGQAAYLTIWFPAIVRLARESPQGVHYQLPPSLSGDYDSIKALKPLAEIEVEREIKARARDELREKKPPS